MVDKPNPSPGSGTETPGQGVIPAGQPPAPQGGEGQQFLTREEFMSSLANLDKKWSESQTRLGIKQADFAQKVQGDLSALKQSLDIMKASGVQVTPEQEASMRNQVIARAFETPAGQPGGQVAQPPTAQPIPGNEWLPEGYEEPPDPVTLQAWNIMDQMGVDITDKDPEFQLLDRSDDPNAFLASVKPACEAKIKRLAGGLQAPQPAHMPTNLGGGGALANDWQGKIHDPDEIWKGMQNTT